jgi:pilus assembly protein FimV
MNARSIILAAGLTGMFCAGANALGIVRAPAQVTLGATLNFAVAVHVASDESLTSPCVTADVQQGEQRVAPSTLQIHIEPGPVPEERIVRITSTTAIEEPFVTITIGLGCGNRLERRFTVLADPPLVTVAGTPEPAQPVARTDAPAAATPPRAGPAAAPRPDPAPTASPATLAGTAPQATAAPARAAAPRSTGAARSADAAPARARRVARAAPSAPNTAAAPTARAVPQQRPTTAAAPSGPRLQLDPVEPAARPSAAASAAVALQEAQLRVAAMAASAAVAEQAASTALANAALAADRMRQIEEGVAKLRVDIERDREQMLTLRAQLARAESTSKLAPWLGAGMALLAALALWLWLRMRRMQREQQAQWWAASKLAANSKQPPLNPPTLHPMTLPPHMAPATPPVRPAATPVPAPVTKAPPGRTQSPAFRDSLFTSQQETRDVSIEELIDLEQQAEFFVVLGQDDAAIDLLIGHIRASGGTSPLPYLKLLEIYRRLGDRESYERTRERFNHRFNAYAPDWDSDLQHGRALDEYPGVVQRLQQAWANPLDAMAELEALMFRRDGGELFELPAYREVLFLYSMARDLLDHQGGPPTSIDVLLPLTETATFEPTTAHPHLFTSATGLAELSRATDPPIELLRPSAPVEFDEQPSGSQGVVDLDLTKPLPMADDTVVLRREDTPEQHNPDQRSDFADLPLPPAPKKR